MSWGCVKIQNIKCVVLINFQYGFTQCKLNFKLSFNNANIFFEAKVTCIFFLFMPMSETGIKNKTRDKLKQLHEI
jgi:hypothetical protein